MRWLVIALACASCADSTEANLDDAAEREPHCLALAERVCDACDPEREHPECAPLEVDDFCAGLDWYCTPIPTVRQANECRRAFAQELSRSGCVSLFPEDFDVPECQRFDACID